MMNPMINPMTKPNILPNALVEMKEYIISYAPDYHQPGIRIGALTHATVDSLDEAVRIARSELTESLMSLDDGSSAMMLIAMCVWDVFDRASHELRHPNL